MKPANSPSPDTVIRLQAAIQGAFMGDTRTNKLTAKHCENAAIGKHADGGGRYLLVKPNGKYWRYDYRIGDKRKTCSLGVYPAMSLKEARVKHGLLKADVAQGVDPMAVRKQAKEEARIDATASFATLAGQWLENTAKARAWGDKHRKTTEPPHPARIWPHGHPRTALAAYAHHRAEHDIEAERVS